MQKIFLLDGYNLMYRMFYAVPPFTAPDGAPVNAVFGLAKMLLGFHTYDSPDHLAVIMDSKAENFRSKIYPEYKAQRDRMPDDLRSQESLIFELFEVMEIPMIAKEGFEADDIIGTFATKLEKDPENDIYIVSGDKDLYQFVGDRVAVYDTMKRVIARRKEAIEKFGVPPERVVDYLAIVGDTSDNIPGIMGFGPKKAEALITQYGSLEDIYEHADEVSGKVGETLRASREVAFLSKKLASIDCDVAVTWDSEATKFNHTSLLNDRTIEFFKRLNFKSLLPVSEVKVSRFEDLKIQAKEITLQSEITELIAKIKSAKTITLATYGSRDQLSGVVLRLDEKGEYFKLRPEVTVLTDIIESLLALPESTKLLGYDLKTDLRRMYAYQKNTSSGINVANLSLF